MKIIEIIIMNKILILINKKVINIKLYLIFKRLFQKSKKKK